MKKRILITVGMLLGGAVVTSCVSPFYGTARIEEEFHVDVGLAGVSYMVEDDPSFTPYHYFYGPEHNDPHYYGLRGDVEVRYGLNKYIQGSARIGIGWGFNGKLYYDVYPSVEDHFLLDVGIGAQFAAPIYFKKGGQITPTIRLEGCYGYGEFYALPTFLIGIWDPEILTLGARFYNPWPGTIFPSEIFAGVHIRRFDIFAGVNVWTTWLHPDYWRVPPVATVGLGYNLK